MVVGIIEHKVVCAMTVARAHPGVLCGVLCAVIREGKVLPTIFARTAVLAAARSSLLAISLELLATLQLYDSGLR